MRVTVPQLPWYGDSDLELSFPDSWRVTVCEMAGKECPKITDRQLQEAFLHPIGMPRIAQMARGRENVVIIFDDLSRPTKVAELVPCVLAELKEGGIEEKNIRFIAALGCHGAMKLMDFEKKLGRDVVKRFPVYNHNPYENCTFLGHTSRGTPISVNSEVMSCDLKIAIGAVLPHPLAGFGGGGKIMLPGVAGIDTIWADHHDVGGRGKPVHDNPMGNLHPTVGIGKIEENVLRLDIEEAARMAGLDFTVNAVVNSRRETVGLFVGDLVAAHREGVKLARRVYATETPRPADIVIANAYAKANEAIIAVQLAYKFLKAEGGTLVVMANIPEGQICHYLTRSFGKNIGGRLWGRREFLPPRTKKIIALGPYIDRAGLDWIGPADQITIADSWPEIVTLLKEDYGDNAEVAVLPDATLQYFPAQDASGSKKGPLHDGSADGHS